MLKILFDGACNTFFAVLNSSKWLPLELLVVPTGSLSLRVLLTAAGRPLVPRLRNQFCKEGGISKKGLVPHVRTLCLDQSVGCCTQHHREDFVALSPQWEGMVVEAERDAERATAASLLKECDSTDSGETRARLTAGRVPFSTVKNAYNARPVCG